ncbi:HAMP domain-containing sensor histidine kinase [uncultured Massilia sp.]|uniref:GAF domain-containing sensor histidine kinase n=1 Tax=uncultured Massilia sp. TaxID=169973 RepID=UPI002584147C|nr:HAMP domain-containing sensor histidine kinase [uncultured Massilia sp.]
MNTKVMTYVREIEAIGAVPKILETVASLTGVGFVAIAHVAETSWTACAVWDKLDFGLKAGDGLDVTTTLCEEVRSTRGSIVIDHVELSEQYREHRTPRIYGFQSYFSIPILRRDGSYFGTLCGLDPKPMTLSAAATVSTLELFAQLVSGQLETERLHAAARTDLSDERETAELREQFIAVLGHDLRTPLNAFQNGVDLLGMKTRDDAMLQILQRMGRSVDRMSALVDDLVDFTRGRMGGGIAVSLREERGLELQFGQVIAELRAIHSEAEIVDIIQSGISLCCDAGRLCQLLSNLIKNAIVHGAQAPVQVLVTCTDRRFFMSVTNEGDALPPHVVQQLFKPYWRSPSSTRHEGLGLGLYIVAEIARAHQGAIDVASLDGRVCFTFSMLNLERGHLGAP